MACIGQFLTLAEIISSHMAAMVPVSQQVTKMSSMSQPVPMVRYTYLGSLSVYSACVLGHSRYAAHDCPQILGGESPGL